jgi:MATE family multidrug resistance protein
MIVVLGNIMNAIRDYLLVFGYNDIIPSLGCRGAARATSIAEAIQIIIFAMGFWSSRRRKHYNTVKDYNFKKDLFWKCIKVGMPMSFGKCAELFAGYLVYVTLSHASKDLATIHGIAITIYVLFSLICEGLAKGSAAISANFVGQNDLHSIRMVVKKLAMIRFILYFILALPLLVTPNLFCKFLSILNKDIFYLNPSM